MALHRGTALREGAVSQTRGDLVGLAPDWVGKGGNRPCRRKARAEGKKPADIVNYKGLNRLFFM